MNCTPLTARWCPEHGQCVCPPPSFERPDCPLHGTRTAHPTTDRSRPFSSCARCVELVPRLRFSLDESIEALQDAAEFVERLATLVAATGPPLHRKHARQIRNRAAAMRVLSIQLLGGS